MSQNRPFRPDHDGSADPGDLGARIAALKAARKSRDGRRPSAGGGRRGYGLQMALRLSADIASGFAVGGVIGYAIDRWAGTIPLFLVIMLFFGGATGVREAIRSMRRLEVELESEREESTDDGKAGAGHEEQAAPPSPEPRRNSQDGMSGTTS